jgi:succinate dehydrogenase / fumarate reductase flavoprotein subunit
MKGLYAAGECCSLYHGANRLGGNSLLGAIYGGQTAAQSLCKDLANEEYLSGEFTLQDFSKKNVSVTPAVVFEVSDILYKALGIVRNETEMKSAMEIIEGMMEKYCGNEADIRRLNLARMMLSCAIYRKESRGAHYRSDYPDENDKFKRYIKCNFKGILTDEALE